MAGVTALAAAGMGFARRPLQWWERAALGAAALALLLPGLTSDGFGIMAMTVIVARN